VCIDPTNYDVDTLSPSGLGGFKHGVRFAYASRGAKENLEFTPGPMRLFLLHTGQ